MMKKALLFTIFIFPLTLNVYAQGFFTTGPFTNNSFGSGPVSTWGWGENFDRTIDTRPNPNPAYGTMTINYHTGLTFSAHSFYGGIRFYNQGFPNAYDPATGAKMVMSITDGNVGIGIVSPAARLHLFSSYDVGSVAAVKMFYQGTWGTADYATNYRFLDIASTEGGKVLQVNGSGVGIGVDAPTFNSPDKLYVTGNVGIGTTSPDAKLSVNGTIHGKEVKVDMNGWPDYVFKPFYSLPSLKEIKTYIDKNGHLPEAPSEKEIAENGIELGEMNKLLMKKVEELTLYLIKQAKTDDLLQKQFQAQQGEINLLKEKLKTLKASGKQ